MVPVDKIIALEIAGAGSQWRVEAVTEALDRDGHPAVFRLTKDYDSIDDAYGALSSIGAAIGVIVRDVEVVSEGEWRR